MKKELAEPKPAADKRVTSDPLKRGGENSPRPGERQSQHAVFSYSALAASVAQDLKCRADSIRSLMRRSCADMIELGEALIAAKKEVGHGSFGLWLDAERLMSQRSAQRFMVAAEFAEGKSDTVSLLEPTALHMLAAQSTPSSAKDQILTRLEHGEQMPTETVRRIVSMAKKDERTKTNGEVPPTLLRKRIDRVEDIMGLIASYFRDMTKEQRKRFINRLQKEYCQDAEQPPPTLASPPSETVAVAAPTPTENDQAFPEFPEFLKRAKSSPSVSGTPE